MKKILIATDFYYPNKTSIGICTDKIVKEFIYKNYQVEVISYGPTTEKYIKNESNLIIHNIKYRGSDCLINFSNKTKNRLFKYLSNFLAMFLKRIGNILWLYWSPMSSLNGVIRYYNFMKDLYDDNNYEFVLSTYSPFEATVATYLLKKKKDFKWIMYILDTFSNRGDSKWLGKEFNEKKGKEWEIKLFNSADLILNMKSHEKHHKQEFYDPFRDRMRFVDIPLFDLKLYQKKHDYYSNHAINIVYTGRILSHLTKPNKLCNYMYELTKTNNWIMHFYSSGDCENYIKNYEQKSNRKIIAEGLVSRDNVIKIISSSDVLISIGCEKSEKIPSKIFDYISANKKIIHFKKSDLDAALYYYESYPNVLVIDEKDDELLNCRKIEKFINSKKENEIDLNKLKEIYYMNTPEFTYRTIIDFFMKENRNE